MTSCDFEDRAEPGVCDYCGAHGPVLIEPFGRKLACKADWEAICYDEMPRGAQ